MTQPIENYIKEYDLKIEQLTKIRELGVNLRDKILSGEDVPTVEVAEVLSKMKTTLEG